MSCEDIPKPAEEAPELSKPDNSVIEQPPELSVEVPDELPDQLPEIEAPPAILPEEEPCPQPE